MIKLLPSSVGIGWGHLVGRLAPWVCDTSEDSCGRIGSPVDKKCLLPSAFVIARVTMTICSFFVHGGRNSDGEMDAPVCVGALLPYWEDAPDHKSSVSVTHVDVASRDSCTAIGLRGYQIDGIGRERARGATAHGLGHEIS